MCDQSLAEGSNQLRAPYGSSRTAENVPFCFCKMDARWAFVVGSSFGPMHVSSSWQMLMCKFDYEDLGAVLESVEGFAGCFPVD